MGVNLVFPYYPNKNAFVRHFRWEYQAESRLLKLDVPAYAGFVPAIRRLIAGLLLSKGYSPRESFLLESIVDELSNNAIEQGLPIDKKFNVCCSFDKSKVNWTVVNSCSDLSLEAQELIREKLRNPCIIPGSMRGRGIALVKKIANQMDFRVSARTVEVSITKMREDS
jgi:anti-sigma regulatory factor (Ser/Thr protein kinase)